jgi:GT2 family glycosyltransferase
MSVDQRRRAVTRRKLPTDPEELPIGGAIKHACWLADRLLAAIVELPEPVAEPVELRVLAEGSLRPCSAALAGLDAVSAKGKPPWHRMLLVVDVDDPGDGDLGPIVVRSKQRDVVLEPLELRPAPPELESLIRELQSTPQQMRERIVQFLVTATTDVTRSRRKLAVSLNRIRDGLRERLPLSVVDPGETRGIAVDAIWRLDDHDFYVEGWAHHDGAELESLSLVSPEGERVEIGESAFRYPRADVSAFYGIDCSPVDDLGFIAYVRTTTPSVLTDGWLVELRDSLGGRVEARAPATTRDLTGARSTILGDIALELPPHEMLKNRHIRPALERVQQRLVGRVSIETVDQLGVPPVAPDVSIVVPLYKRVDFLEHQLAQLVHDPEVHDTDLVYVLDSPEQAEYLRVFARQLYRLYRVPFRVVTLTGNGGFSAANNLGASVAMGRLLLLMNSDVLPEQPGWLGRLVRFYDETPKIGALAPKLVYEDDSLQHAGLYFDRPDGAGAWANEHFFKGLHRDLPAANVARPVPAVTGACLMIDRSLFLEHGGLRGEYVQGDYEDSDLCLRLAESGLESWYVPEVTLYHLEGQSYPTAERALASQYNKWLHTHLWGDSIERVMATYGGTR